MTVLIGIDGGGSGCRVAIARPEGGVPVVHTGPGANVTTDPDRAVKAIRELLESTAERAGLPVDALDSAIGHAGLAGVQDADIGGKMKEALPGAFEVTDERPTWAVGALGDRDGAVVAVGTGSFVVRKRGDEIDGLGGRGPRIGDQASGVWIGRKAAEAALLTADGLNEESALAKSILARHGGPEALVAKVASNETRTLAALAYDVVRAAEQDDAVASEIVNEGVCYLDRALDRLSLTGADVICLVGSVAPHYATRLAPRHRVRLSQPFGTALEGALQLASARA